MKKIFALVLVFAFALVLVSCGANTEEATIESIEVVSQPRKLEYEVGESHDYTGIRVDAIYTDGKHVTLSATEYTFSGFSTTTTGSKTITVTHTASGLTATFAINVLSAQVVDQLLLTAQPTQRELLLNQDLSLAGISLTAIYNRGRIQVVTSSTEGLTFTGYDKTVEGEQDVTVSFGGKSVTITVNVTDPNKLTVTGIQIVSGLDKTIYGTGEAISLAGLVVNKVYDNSSTEVVDNAELTILGFNTQTVRQNAVLRVVYNTFEAELLYSVVNATVQGVTSTTIKIGNTAAVSGAFAVVGIPFNNGIRAAIAKFNADGGFNGRTIEFITYDDAFNAENGITYTKRLVEEDNIFALVGHFGTPTVGATINYIQETGIPMVYAATGINSLYFQSTPGNPVMAVQPIYLTDGRIMTARLLNESVYGALGDQKLPANAKVGVLHTTDDAGLSIKAGIELEAMFNGKNSDFIYKSFAADQLANLDTAINDLLAAGVQAIVIAANQAPFKVAVGALNDAGSEVPVFTSYVSANADSVDKTINYSFDMYANAWLDIVDPNGQYGLSDAYWAFATDMTTAGYPEHSANAYAMAGYIAASIFIEGIKRVGTNVLTWETYIQAMESAPINVPMGGFVDFSGGKRWGIDSMALLKLSITGEGEGRTATWNKFRDIETLGDIQAK